MLKIKLATLKFKCQKCPPQQEAFNFDEMRSHMQKECPKRIVECPNSDCLDIVRASDLCNHLGDCYYTLHTCKKCEKKIHRGEIK